MLNIHICSSLFIWLKGGTSARIAWPRLAEYFARFKLSLDMTCSLEVLAPTLSRVPLWVHPNEENTIRSTTCESMKTKRQSSSCESMKINQCATKGNDKNLQTMKIKNPICPNQKKNITVGDTALQEKSSNQKREQIWKATQSYLARAIDLVNVAYASVPIRMENNITSKKIAKNCAFRGPQLAVAVVVHNRSIGEDDDGLDQGLNDVNDDKGSNSLTNDRIESEALSSKSASMVLIRMVNKIPLLDSAEAAACGLIYGLASKKRMWNSFGLEAHLNIDPSKINAIPTFDVRDSVQVMPFFNQGTHDLLEYASDSDDDNDPILAGAKRKRHRGSRNLRPASLRLGHILLIVQIHAEPATLPLPTLCKVRRFVILPKPNV